AGAAVGLRWTHQPVVPFIPELRSTPLQIVPVFDYDVVVTDEQLSRVLTKLQPRLAGDKTKINSLDHALRFWGTNTKFTQKDSPSGAEMRRILVDNERFVKLYGKAGEEKPLLIDTPDGVRVRTAENEMSASHVDHTVASLAEVGTPLNFPIQTPERITTYRAMVDHALRSFKTNQVEYEWTAMTFALFMPPHTTWRTVEGQEMNFDRLAERMMRQDQPGGVCFGNHRLYSLVLLLRVHEESPILSDEVHGKIVAYLREMTALLVKHQHADGFWNGNWPSQKPADSKPTESEAGLDRLSDRIIATGHALEWWAMVPASLADELHPPRAVLASAGQWIVKTVDSLTDQEIPGHFTFLSHAGRSLALWRKKFPHEVPLHEPKPAAEETKAAPPKE
ncbi:MAG TPA: hypothetical protein VL096_14220, partial [Pirellulaceae bacterium]|nr:hypothetical protein [Pirellulaceae bacterium]